jgi:hypothetical protein
MDDKLKFFGQYLGQKVAKETEFPKSPTINTTVVLCREWVEFYHLELKNPYKMSEEDLALFAKNKNVVAIDFMRSLGYAQQFIEWSIDELVSKGWVKLI